MSDLFSLDSSNSPKQSPKQSPKHKSHYHFRYSIFNVELEFQETQLVVQMGIKAHVINLTTLFALYRRDLKSQGISELTLAFKHKNKIKRARIYADRGEAEFDAFVDALKALKPNIDISDLPEKKAYEHMGSQDQPWLVILGLMSFSIVLIAILGLPLLLHGLDHGQWKLPLAEVYQNPKLLNQGPSRNLIFSGHLDLEQALTLIEGKGDEQQKQIVAPLYPKAVQSKKQPAVVLVSLKGRALKHLNSLQQGQVQQGILRNIWWEGLGEQTKLKLKEKGVKISDQSVLIEMGITQRDDLQLYLSFILALSLFTTIAVLYLKPVNYKT